MKITKKKNKPKNLYDYLGEVKDYRRKEGRKHELRFILLLIIMGIMNGGTSLRAIEDFIKKNKKELIKTFKPKNNWLPSLATLFRTTQGVNFNQLNKAFLNWTKNFVSISEKEWISIDGKIIKGTGDGRGNFTGLVSLFASKQRQILSTNRTHHQKETEIPTVRKLLKQLRLKKNDLNT